MVCNCRIGSVSVGGDTGKYRNGFSAPLFHWDKGLKIPHPYAIWHTVQADMRISYPFCPYNAHSIGPIVGKTSESFDF